jgi:hypothetical protein
MGNLCVRSITAGQTDNLQTIAELGVIGLAEGLFESSTFVLGESNANPGWVLFIAWFRLARSFLLYASDN